MEMGIRNHAKRVSIGTHTPSLCNWRLTVTLPSQQTGLSNMINLAPSVQLVSTNPQIVQLPFSITFSIGAYCALPEDTLMTLG